MQDGLGARVALGHRVRGAGQATRSVEPVAGGRKGCPCCFPHGPCSLARAGRRRGRQGRRAARVSGAAARA
eukprot:228066-Lingulodinium_polyedra.AAC.1